MSFSKALGFGIVIWLVAFVVAALFVGYGKVCTSSCNLVTTLATLIVAYFLARKLNVDSKGEMIKYAIVWVVVGLILDALITVRFTDWSIFRSAWLWIAYLLLLLVPLLAVKKQPAVM